MSTTAQPWDIHLDMACPECDRLENEFKVADAEFIGALSLPLRVDAIDPAYQARQEELVKLRDIALQAEEARDKHVSSCGMRSA